jgi:hypothetical protein
MAKFHAKTWWTGGVKESGSGGQSEGKIRLGWKIEERVWGLNEKGSTRPSL